MAATDIARTDSLGASNAPNRKTYTQLWVCTAATAAEADGITNPPATITFKGKTLKEASRDVRLVSGTTNRYEVAVNYEWTLDDDSGSTGSTGVEGTAAAKAKRDGAPKDLPEKVVGADGTDTTPYYATISSVGVELQEPMYKDRNGTAIVNSAGQPFDPPITESVYQEDITVTWFAWDVNAAGVRGKRGKVNSGALRVKVGNYDETYDAEMVKLVTANYEIQYNAAGDPFYKVTIVLRYKDNGWKRSILDQGYLARSTTGGWEIPKDENLNAISSLVCLDGSGKFVTPGGAKHFLEFDTVETADLSTVLPPIE